MTNVRAIIALSAALLTGMHTSRSAETLPPLVATSAATTLDSGGRPWAYVILGENRPGLIASHRFAAYSRSSAGASFVPRGPITAAQDPSAIAVMLARGASLGDNLGALETQLIALHGWLLTTPGQPPATAPAMSLAQRLSALQARAAGDGRLSSLLDLYGLSHPALRLVRGTAWAGRLDVPIGTEVTIEIRETDSSNQDLAVIGRVTLHAGQPEVLPAPGPIVAVPDLTGQSDLAVKLRWATPDALRLASTRHHGDVAWRVAKAVAEASGFDKSPPAASVLDQLAISNPANAHRLAGPIFPTKLFDALSVSDFTADRTNSFILDDNDRSAAGGSSFVEGSQYYYFVAAADVLGHPGNTSPGLLASMCRHIPPPIPPNLKVTVQWNATDGQYWDISWTANPAGAGTPTTAYEVYRGNDFTDLTAAQRGNLNLEANPIFPSNTNGIQRIAMVPDPGIPGQVLHAKWPGDGSYGRMWWFAIRAVHSGPPTCGDLASALSTPALSTLPDKRTPVSPPPSALQKPTLDCLRLVSAIDRPPAPEAVSQTLDPSTAYYVARCRRYPGLSAAHFRVTNLDTAAAVLPDTIAVFPTDEDTVEVSWTLPLGQAGSQLKVECQAEALGNYQSAWVASLGTGVSPAGNQQMVFSFVGAALAESERKALATSDPLYPLFQGLSPADCALNWTNNIHLVVSPGTGRILHPQLQIPLGEKAKQYRLYRKIDGGALTLVAQGLQDYGGPGSTVATEDPAPPVSNGAVDYFAQFLDENGVSSTMRHLAHLAFTGDTPPVPVLLTPSASDYGGTPAAPTVTLTWVEPPDHVERFEILLAVDKPASDPDPHVRGITGVLNSRLSPQPVVWKTRSKLNYLQQVIASLPQSYLTGRVGNDYQAGPRFTFTLQIDPALKYSAWIRALGPGGEPSGPSRTIEVQWQPPAAPPSNIPWPQRPLPPVASFNSGIQVVDFRDIPDSRLIWTSLPGAAIPIQVRTVAVDTTPVGIRVGSLPVDGRSFFSYSTNPPGPTFFAPGSSASAGRADPNLQIYKRDGDNTQALLPAVLYRQQVANDRFPNVSGDVIQCSPLIRSVAWLSQRINTADVLGQLVDPLFRWVHPDFQNGSLLELYLVDTQPVVEGARYHYWLMRFSDLGEPIQTVPCGEVTVKTP